LNPIYNFLHELKPYALPGGKRIRLGLKEDGGYVLFNKGLENIDVLYSYGVETNSDFELMFCEKYNSIARLYDHTVDLMPVKRDFLYFKKEGVGPVKTNNLNTIENHINENEDRNKKLILKIDTEGAEWDTFHQMPNEILGSFEQIVMEIHGLHSEHPDYNGTNLFKSKIERKTQIINKINKLFYLYHVHANNYQPLFYTGRFKLPNAMELTFVNKEYFKNVEYSKTIFPTKFDAPNYSKREDINLHFWPFYPGIMSHVKLIITQNSWYEGWKKILDLISRHFESKWKSIIIAMKLRRPTSYS